MAMRVLHHYRRQVAIRIAAVSLIVAALVSAIAWWVSIENLESEAVGLAVEESRRAVLQMGLDGEQPRPLLERAQEAARLLTGGFFDIAEIYDAQGHKLAEHATARGHAVEPALARHPAPQHREAGYESLQLPDGTWVLRVFVPVRRDGAPSQAAPIGFVEGVRVVPDWQREQLRGDAIGAASLAALAALLCGVVIYPIVIHLSRDNERKALQVLESHVSMMEALGRAIAKRDSDTGAHNYRVAWLAARLGEALGLSGDAMRALIIGSFLHDVGKIGIPDAILLKPGRLDEQEMRIMRTHVQLGEDIVRDIPWLAAAAQVVACHHEKWDGTGYPRGLRGDAIPLSARIFAVADVFDALCSRRPYKAPMPPEQAIALLERDSGSHFDPQVVRTFVPLSATLHQQLDGLDEAGCRALLHERIRHHFGFG
ncbi:3'3'-cGAMP-specific phosphodiesterase 2 [Tepidimonas thermarum]|uniref:3'3'-cGAMP-specific phosphodiesterase 2 n=1 Tax=Tepidimonas thermarum TaxID=335431 RepID=A0A554WYL8_9BURK|nr:HD-GYP domain-containing protein [Tepidimonas thermarum]TSE28674.1 3'3'-cGAMP-specific phosphodiesterase 2 [Tepidimonas thermarum]